MKSLMGRTWTLGAAGLLLGSLLVTSAEAARGGGPPGMAPRGVSRGHVPGPGSAHHPRAWRGGGGGHGHGGWGHKGGWGHHHGGWGGWGWWPGGFAVGVGVGAALTSPWWWGYPAVYAAPAYPYAYPAAPVYAAPPAVPYGYPAYPAPPPPPPAPEYAPPAEPSGSTTLTPTPGLSTELSPLPPGAPPPHAGTGANCETVTVVGHWQTRVYPDGQRMTVWVPTSTRSICR